MKGMLSLMSVLVLIPLPCLGFHNFLINGSSTPSLTTADTIIVDGNFEIPGARASAKMLYNLAPTYPMLFVGRAIDGDYDDEDETANGIYHAIESPLSFTGQYLVIAEDNGVADTVLLTITSISSSYSISGRIIDPANQPHIMVMTYLYDTLTHNEYLYGDFTDNSGNYTISIPDGLGNRWWQIIINDIANTAPYYIGTFDSVYVSGNVTKDLAMFPSLPDTCRIYGTIRDEIGNPLPGPSLLTGFALGPAFSGIRPGLSNSSGVYSIIVPGSPVYAYYNISADIFEQFRPELMEPSSPDTVVFGMAPPYQILIDLKAYRATSTITGYVYKDGLPYDDAQLEVKNDTFGWAKCQSFSDGHYVMPVSDSANLYNIRISDKSVPQGYYVVEGTQTVPPGATNIDFHLEPLGISENEGGPKTFQFVVFPNPFSEFTNLQIPSSTLLISLEIYNATGRLVKRFNYLTNYKSSILWDGTDDFGGKLPAGIYFIRLESDDFTITEKAILLR